MSQAYKKALHSFFLKVHPDFFARNPEWQRSNETSIAALNELLNWARDLKSGSHRAPPSTSIDFTFYRRPDEADVAPAIVSKFELPRGFVAGPTTIGTAERAVNKFLRDLLRRADCLDTGTAGLSEAQDNEQVRMEQKRTHNPRRQPRKVRTLLDEAYDTAAEVAMPRAAPSIDDLIESDQIMFDRKLTPQQCAVAVSTLSGSLPELKYEEWYLMPLVISDRWGVEVDNVRGAMTVPWSFTVAQFLAFLVAERKAIRAVRTATESFATQVETLIGEISRNLDLDDILITASHAEAITCLRLLKEHTSLIALHDITGLTIEIGDHWGYRDNGVLIFDKRASLDTLHKKLPKFAALVPELRQRYQRAKRLLTGIDWHLEQVREALSPQMIDVFTADAPYEARLQFMEELLKVAPRLSEFDWSDITFALAPSEEQLHIDWAAGIVMMPATFDGENFLRYVTDLHTEAKAKEEQKLEEYEAARRAKQEAQRLAAGVLRHEDLAHSSGDSMLPDGSAPAASHDGADDGAHGPGDVAEYDPLQSLDGRSLPPRRPTGPSAADAWRAEYLMSSQRGGEELSVEPPLAHQTDFSNVNDAEDQLEWEGANRSPYVDLQRPADSEAMEHLARHTNNVVREEAIKKITDELKRKYGYRNEGFKLGDVVGLNDPKIKARRYPTVAQGTHVPPKGSNLNRDHSRSTF